MPMIPLGLKETKEIDFREPFKVSTGQYILIYMIKNCCSLLRQVCCEDVAGHVMAVIG